jgi:hypothetical protein
MPTGPSRNSPSLRSRRGMHRRTVTGVSEDLRKAQLVDQLPDQPQSTHTTARQGSGAGCGAARSRIVASIQPPCTRRPPSWTAGFRPGRSTGWPRSVRPRWTLGAGTPARWSRRSAMRAWWGTTSTPSGWPTRWPTRHADRESRSPSVIGPHLRPAVPHPQAAGDRGGAAHPAGRGAAAGPRHDEDRTRGRQVGESRQHQVASVVGQRHGTEPRVDAAPSVARQGDGTTVSPVAWDHVSGSSASASG